MSHFLKAGDVRQETFEWGQLGWRLTPEVGGGNLVVIDAILEPGQGHAFHRHPGQEEVIIVRQGSVIQYLEEESTTLESGDSVFIEAGVVHASYNDGDQTAHLQVVISPALGNTTGYDLEDVSGDDPWKSLRSAT